MNAPATPKLCIDTLGLRVFAAQIDAWCFWLRSTVLLEDAQRELARVRSITEAGHGDDAEA